MSGRHRAQGPSGPRALIFPHPWRALFWAGVPAACGAVVRAAADRLVPRARPLPPLPRVPAVPRRPDGHRLPRRWHPATLLVVPLLPALALAARGYGEGSASRFLQVAPREVTTAAVALPGRPTQPVGAGRSAAGRPVAVRNAAAKAMAQDVGDLGAAPRAARTLDAASSRLPMVPVGRVAGSSPARSSRTSTSLPPRTSSSPPPGAGNPTPPTYDGTVLAAGPGTGESAAGTLTATTLTATRTDDGSTQFAGRPLTTTASTGGTTGGMTSGTILTPTIATVLTKGTTPGAETAGSAPYGDELPSSSAVAYAGSRPYGWPPTGGRSAVTTGVGSDTTTRPTGPPAGYP